jgi:uncharacterized protein (DUF2236 family)
MCTKYFVDKQSVVRQIWGKSDTILFIFAGASAEFALNKAVDWLYFTGKLPADPLGRLFSTVSYAKTIIFSNKKDALHAIDTIANIHAKVEMSRGQAIPDWAYRDVLFMLIDYSIRSFELLERKLENDEKNEIFRVFIQVGIRMGLKGLPGNFEAWEKMRHEHLAQHMQYSHFTKDLFLQYKKHLGPMRYRVLLEAQGLVVPQKVRQLLGYSNSSLLSPFVPLYKAGKSLKIDWLLKALLLPPKYKKEIRAMDS